ncbi:hypothetical protein RR11_640 [Ruegeria sp. R11]|nr:hypothetical protein RR11_640 [Ruegeria sp. R11]
MVAQAWEERRKPFEGKLMHRCHSILTLAASTASHRGSLLKNRLVAA